MFGSMIDVDVQRSWLERDPCEILNLGGLCCREQHGLTLRGQDLDNRPHLILETDLENSVRFVDDERPQVLENEALCVV